MSINELQDEVIAEFSDFDDWMDRYQLLIDLGNEQEPLEEKYKTEQNLIEGCQSRVWLQADEVDGKIVFKAESDALIVKGIIALLIKVLSGHTPDEILNTDLYFVLHIVQNVGHAVVYVLGRVAETFGKELVFLCTLLQVHQYRFLKMVSSFHIAVVLDCFFQYLSPIGRLHFAQ